MTTLFKIALIVLGFLTVIYIAYKIVRNRLDREEEEKYLKDPNAYMLETVGQLKVVQDFVNDDNRRTMLFPYGSGIFCPQEKGERSKVQKDVRLVYGLGKADDGTLTVLSIPFGKPLPEGIDLEKRKGVPVTNYNHEFLEDLTDFILDIYKTSIPYDKILLR